LACALLGDHVAQNIDVFFAGQVHRGDHALHLRAGNGFHFAAHAIGKTGSIGHQAAKIVKQTAVRLGHVAVILFASVRPCARKTYGSPLAFLQEKAK
jgi:hypothetical protein